MKNFNLLLMGTWIALNTLAPPLWAAPTQIQWPKGCREAPTTQGLSSDVRSFCLEFVPDYFYRLHFVQETHTYKPKEDDANYRRPKFSLEGSLFLLGLAVVESGWGQGGSNERHNYWGLHGAKAGSLSKFDSFETAMAFWFNHVHRGIKGNGADDPNHPGWPRFLELMTREKFTADEVNKSLDSGPKYCRTTGHPYNAGNEEYCRTEYDGPNPGCPCVDYAGRILRDPVPRVVSYCLKAYQDEDKMPVRRIHKSAVYSDQTKIPIDQPLPDASERLAAARTTFLSYAMEKCHVTSPLTQAPSPDEVKAISAAEETVRRVKSPSGPVQPCK